MTRTIRALADNALRILTAFGAALFGYLTLVPVGLIGAQVDSACAGEACEGSVVVRVLLVVAYGLCAAALFGTAALMVDHTLRGGPAAQERIVKGLIACGIAVGVTAFGLLALVEPVGAAVALVIAGGCFGGLTYLNRERASLDASQNGHSEEAPTLGGRYP